MTEAAHSATNGTLPEEHVDVLIVGAGISGIGGAYHLTKQSLAPRSLC
jgi:cation diffusion facilitator CzcD-associated flavoprotein CzcO